MKKIKVFIADDHKILRESLVILLAQHENIEVIGEAANGQEAYGKIMKLKPDIAILDISIPQLNGLDLAAKLKQETSYIKIIILTMHKNEDLITRALCMGVEGYVLKDNALEELIKCIETVYDNKIFLSHNFTQLIVDGFIKSRQNKNSLQTEALSAREREILQLLAEGKSNKAISIILNLSIKTVETHRANIMRKMDFNNIVDLVLYAVRNHIIEP
ncbi:response regulator [Clostridium sp. Mt-5]|uniref:Stage 0 sporulation protein A homolog n=1 Tax=Clostridium moutaii TaxID=3240932 RepID=A0ABV4BQL9_9CLOT